jgi:rhodanese-related sulfurtransferase
MRAMHNHAEIDPADATRRHARGEIQLVDVREQSEYDAGHVPGSLHIPMSSIAERSDEIDRDRPVAFICLMGARSAMVTNHFRQQGLDAYNVSGGFARWFQENHPVEPEDAIVAGH